MTSLVQKLSKLATQTFSDLKGKDFQQNLNNLCDLMKQVKPDNVGFKLSDYFKHEDYAPPDKPPLELIKLEENELFIMGIFVLYKGGLIPLHDHPNMYGIIKVIHGRVRFETYSHVSGNKIVDANKTNVPIQYNVMKNSELEVSSEEEKSLLLTPIDNFHDIHPLTGGAAFMDILSPYYDGNRYCHFYNVKKQTTKGEAVLQQIIPGK